MNDTEFSLILSDLIITAVLEVNMFSFHLIDGELRIREAEWLTFIFATDILLCYNFLMVLILSKPLVVNALYSKDGFSLTFG